MSDWDASDTEQPTHSTTPVIPITTNVKTKKWADEDADEGVKDDWEASEESDTEKNEVTKPQGPIRNKGITKMKIAEKEAEEANKAAELEARATEAADPVLRKKREQQRTVEADMENARGLFGDAVISSTGTEDPLKMTPTTKEDFEVMSTALAKIIISKHGSKALYPTFLDHFIRQLVSPISDVHTRKAASALTTIANEKQRIAREAKKGGKGKVKPTLGGVTGTSASVASKGGRGVMADLEVYDQALDVDYDDDFM